MRHIYAISVFLLMSSCTSRPAPTGRVLGSIEGHVFVTGPVEGAKVTAYPLNLSSGNRGEPLGVSEPTTTDGHFRVELRAYQGPVLLVARGIGASYVEPASGLKVDWDASAELSGVWLRYDSEHALSFELSAGEEIAEFVISPFTDLALTFGFGRQRVGLNTTLREAFEKSHRLFDEHLDLSEKRNPLGFWSIPPADLTSGDPKAWDAWAHAGTIYVGLSELVRSMGADSEMPALTTMQLIALLRQDGSGDNPGPGVTFDGTSTEGRLALGTCMRQCQLSEWTLQGELAGAVIHFLNENGRNVSGLRVKGVEGPGAVLHKKLGDLARRRSELFPATGNHAFDVVGPSLTVIESQFADEARLAPSFGPGPHPWGALSYLGPTSAVRLSASQPATFTKYSSRYTATSENLPTWHLNASDNRSISELIRVEAKLEHDGRELTDWRVVPPASGDGYNRAFALSDAISEELAAVSGTFSLRFRAFDELDNPSDEEISVSWTQTVLPPAIRQASGPTCNACEDPQCPAYYTLNESTDCSQPQTTNSAHVAIAGVGLPEGRLKASQGWLSNPNAVPVRVRFRVGSQVSYSRGTRWVSFRVDGSGIGCNADENPSCDPSWGAPPEIVEDGVAGDVQAGVRIRIDGQELAPCPSCAPDEWEIPPHSQVSVETFSRRFAFLFPGDPVALPSLGDAQNVTGMIGPVFSRCVRVSSHFPDRCVEWRSFQAGRFLTRLRVTTEARVSVDTRPAFDGAALVAAPGENTVDFLYRGNLWQSAETGWPLFF